MKRILPSEHEVERVAKEAAEKADKEAALRKARRLRGAVDWLLKQELGRVFWAHLWDTCGFAKESLSYFKEGDVAPLKTECKEAQRVVYLNLRKLATPSLLAQAEFEAEFGTPLEQAVQDEAKSKKGGK